MNQITENLYISNIAYPRTEGTEPFDHVVTVCQDRVDDHLSDDTDYSWFNMTDGDFPNAKRGSFEYSLFAEAVDTVREALRDGQITLVHCHAGISRSPAVSAAALAVERGLSFTEALSLIRRVRKRVNPNTDLRDYGERYVSGER